MPVLPADLPSFFQAGLSWKKVILHEMPHSPSSTPAHPNDPLAETHADKELGGDNGQKRHSNASLSPTERNSECRRCESDAESQENEMQLARTKSVAETLSLPREIIFVAIICSAQLLTRKAHVLLHYTVGPLDKLLTSCRGRSWERTNHCPSNWQRLWAVRRRFTVAHRRLLSHRRHFYSSIWSLR
jgi:hypothetical protein